MASTTEIESCLTCKKPIAGLPICLDSSDPEDNISNRQKLKTLLPEWDLIKNKVYMICWSCSYSLTSSYKFRMMCLSAAPGKKVEPIVVKAEPEDIEDKSTKISSTQNVNLNVAVKPPIAVKKPAVTEDVQKQDAPVVVKTNQNVKNSTTLVTKNTKTVSASFLKQLKNGSNKKVIKVISKKIGPTNVHCQKPNVYAGAKNLKIIKTLRPIKLKQIVSDALLSNSMNSAVVAKPEVIDDKAISDTMQKVSNKLDTKVADKPIVNSDEQNSKLDCPVPVVEELSQKIEKSCDSLKLEPMNLPIVSKELAEISKINDTNVAEISGSTETTKNTSPINVKANTIELDDQRSNRKLIMKTLHKAVLESKSGVTHPKISLIPWKPEKNLSEIIVKNWNKNISYLVRNDLMNTATFLEKEKADECPVKKARKNQQLEIVNKPTPKLNEPAEVKTECEMETDDVEFVSETFLKPSTSKPPLRTYSAKKKLPKDDKESPVMDLPTKTKSSFLCKCNHCGLLLTSKEILVKHIRQHFKNNPVQCEQCKTQFGDISSYNAHTCIYEEGKKALVSEFESECPKPKECKCDLYFGNVRTLNIHLETTCENSTFCMTCNMGFVDTASTDCHLRNVHNLFICNLCRKMFRDKKYLMTHLHVMHERKEFDRKSIYRCPFQICKKAFKFIETFELHLAYKHQDYYSNIYWEDSKTSYVTYMCNLCKNSDKPICLNLLDLSVFIVQLQNNHSL